MDSTYYTLAVVFVGSVFTRTGYELLKEARKINPESKIIFAIILFVMCALWSSWFALCPSESVQSIFPDAVRWTGLVLVIVGAVIAVGALIQLRGVENIDHLVTTGLFSKIRHPMYMGFILWIVGWSTYHSAIVSLAIGMIAIANILYWRRLEEGRLMIQHGETYSQYRRSTWL